MKAVNVSLILSAFLLIGLQQAKAQANKHESKQEVKVKEVEHTESIPTKEVEIKTETEPKEAKSITEHQEPIPVKEQEVKKETPIVKSAEPIHNTAQKSLPFSKVLQLNSSTKPTTVNRANQTSTDTPKK